MNKLYSILYLLAGILCMTSSGYAQENINRSFINGYYGGGMDIDSQYYNNVFVERRDTGLHFSERIASKYDILLSQTSTYCDPKSGKPLLVWQGCTLLDAANMQPIYNGDFSDTKGTKDPIFEYCVTKIHNGLMDTIMNAYGITPATFFLDRGDPHAILLVYYRYENIPRVDSFNIYTATIDLTGSPEGKPAVISKSFEPLSTINLNFLSMNAIRHANGKDWWIVSAEYKSNKLFAILFDQDGIHEPLESVIKEWADSTFVGISAISPDGTKYAYQDGISNYFYILNFDRCTGKFTYFNQGSFPYLDPNNGWVRWCEFAPGGRFFYTASAFDVYQYDLLSPDFSIDWSHVASFDTAQVSDIPGIKGFFGNFFRGYDGHLYLWSLNTVRSIHRIAYPDRKGPDVGWTQDYYHLQFWPSFFVPTLVDYTMGPLAGSPCTSHTDAVGALVLKLYPNPTTKVIRAEGLESRYDHSVVSISDITGREVFAGQGTDLVHGIDVGAWHSGIYLIQVDGRPAGKFAKIE